VPPRSVTWKVAPLLFGSGLCALIYQVAWFRELRHVFGASTSATAAVLAIFMGGLGLGGALLGRRVDRTERPLAFYALLELGVAVSAAVTPFLVSVARSAYFALGGVQSLGVVGGTLARLVLSVLVLAVPTFLMGATLPAAARACETESDERRSALGVLYGVNTLGAVAGTMLANFFLLEAIGISNTLWLACAVNLGVGLAARAIAGTLPAAEMGEAKETAASAGAPAGFVLIAAALTGFAFFSMELVWYRLLAPLLGGSTFTFGLILAMALLGIGTGSALYAGWGKDRPATLGGLALTLGAEALFLALPWALGDRLAIVALLLRSLSAFGFWGLVASWSLVTLVVVFPAALVSGIQFPMLVALLGKGRANVGRQIGLAYACNTVGSIVGSLGGGFGILPLVGALGAWKLVVWTLAGLCAASAALAVRRRGGSMVTFAAPLLGGLALVALTATGPTAAWRHSGIGAGRADPPTLSVNGLRQWMNLYRLPLAWEADGVESGLAMFNASSVSFIINGKTDGNAIGDASTQVMSGLIGAMVHPEPRRSLVIGLGTGSTAGWLAQVPTMERVDVVEIEPKIAEVARACAAVNQSVLDNPKVALHYGDAREVLFTGKERYDVIFSEPSNPYRAGIASLFTTEFYQAVKSRLTDDGVFVQWVQVYEVDAQTVQIAYATLGNVFGSVETWQSQPGDMLLLASNKPLVHDVERMRQRLATEPYRTAAASTWRATTVEEWLAHFIAGPTLAGALAKKYAFAVNTDDQNLIEFGFAQNVGQAVGLEVQKLAPLVKALGADRPRLRGDVEWTRVEAAQRAIPTLGAAKDGAAKPASETATAIQFHAAIQRFDLDRARSMYQESPWVPERLEDIAELALALAEGGDPAAEPWIERLRAYRATDAEILRGLSAWRRGDVDGAVLLLQQGFVACRTDPWVFQIIVQTAMRVAVDIASQDPAKGDLLFAALEQPFAVYVLQAERLTVRAMLDDAMGGKRCVETLSVVEPHGPWTAKGLARRRHCYAAAHHPLAERADAELDEFLSHEPLPFDTDLPGMAAPAP
jgi:spermidine synthase